MKNKIIIIFAGALILLAAVGYLAAFKKAQDQVSVMVASKNLPAFIVVQESDLTVAQIPAGALSPNDLSEADYQADYVAKKVPLIPTMPVLVDAQLDKRAIADKPQASFGIVLPDERVIAVTSSVSGAALGVIQPGNIVDVHTAGSGSGDAFVSSFAKVLCISPDPNGCKGVLASGQSSTIGGDGNSKLANDGGPVKVLLVVDEGDAAQLAGEEVSLSLNTFCAVSPEGYFASTREDMPCKVPTGRLGSSRPVTATAPGTTTQP